MAEGKAPFMRTGLFQRNIEVEGDYCVHQPCNDPPCPPKEQIECGNFIFLVVLNTVTNCFSFWGARDEM